MGHLLARVADKPFMKAAAIESQPETRGALSGFIRDLTELIKARLTLLVVCGALLALAALSLIRSRRDWRSRLAEAEAGENQ